MIVADEMARLKRLWQHYAVPVMETGDFELEEILSKEEAEQMDLFDAMQLRSVIAVCRQSKSLSDAGRKLFAVSRNEKARLNDADRLKKYLAKSGLSWEQIS